MENGEKCPHHHEMFSTYCSVYCQDETVSQDEYSLTDDSWDEIQFVGFTDETDSQDKYSLTDDSLDDEQYVDFIDNNYCQITGCNRRLLPKYDFGGLCEIHKYGQCSFSNCKKFLYPGQIFCRWHNVVCKVPVCHKFVVQNPPTKEFLNKEQPTLCTEHRVTYVYCEHCHELINKRTDEVCKKCIRFCCQYPNCSKRGRIYDYMCYKHIAYKCKADKCDKLSEEDRLFCQYHMYLECKHEGCCETYLYGFTK